MKIRHKVHAVPCRSAAVTAEYQAEVDRDTSKAMVAYGQAQRRLAAAELRQHKADERVLAAPSGRKRRDHLVREAQVAAEIVEMRREELQRIEALMKGIPASTQHRGRKAHRPVPQPGSLI